MKAKLGENIQNLSKTRDFTTAQPPESMDVSLCDTVNCENGAALPGVSPARASVCSSASPFPIRSEMEIEIARIVDEAAQYREADPQKSREILEAGLVRYPDNVVLRHSVLYTMNYTSDPDSMIAYASRLISDTEDSAIRYDALRFLAYAYHSRGEREAAVSALEQVPELSFTRLSEMAFVANGQKKREAAEKQLWISFETVIQMLWKLAECHEESGDIEGTLRRVRQAQALIGALHGEEQLADFQTYVDYLSCQEKRLNALRGGTQNL